MANNRMWLVHKPSGASILLAKYYPSTGWYIFHPQKLYDHFLGKYAVNSDPTFGDTGFELRYEIGEPEINGDEEFPYNWAEGKTDANL